MPDVLIRNLKPETVAYWKERARRNRRSLQAELAVVLEGRREPPRASAASFRERAERLREALLERRGGVPIRDDRDTDHGRIRIEAGPGGDVSSRT